MSKDTTKDADYVAPQVNDLETVVEPEVQKTKVTASTPAKTVTYEEEPTVIGVSSLTGAKGDVASDVLISRLNQHLKYLNGEEGFTDLQHRNTEQASFIESVAGAFQLPYEQFAIVTDAILKVVQENPGTFQDGKCFRFLRGLEETYPLDSIRTYREYFSLLIMISKNWTQRYKLNRVIDIATAVKNLPSRNAKENVTQYFNNLMNV